ncbi:MAG: amidohydrolase family protein, partial [Anderseniella sp.]|nr:amidohydrolase family protein [Anderseniella sp.]
RQSLHQAVHGYTAGGAYAEFSETCKGALKKGSLADIVMLDGNIETTDPGAIDTMEVTTTICDGVITYQS